MAARTAIALAALLGGLAGCDEPEPPIPEMMPIADFTLVDQSGAELSSRALRGKVWIADVMFTSCPEICPLMSTQMANLHRRVTHPEVRFVSVTVDPAVDTPEVLRAYAERYGADTSRWSFLSGQPDDVQRVIQRSFRLPTGERLERDDGSYDILHTARFLLIDRRMTLRGLYETDRAGLDRLERDIARLLEEAE
ncbi:MAG: SCO family protein [Sandaracinaceae bacterium]|nr:SCO family protein [Sandaracinaceae bacterium]